jgi:hypothetical protein
MQVTVKVFVTLRRYLPPELSQQVEFEVSLAALPGEPKRIQDLIDHLHLPQKEIGQIILNGHIKWDKTIELNPNDRVILQPYIGGG